MLKEFDPAAASTVEVLICYFYDGLRPSIQAKTDKRGQDLDTRDKIIKKAINAKVEAARQPQSLMNKMDNCCPWGHRPTNTDKPAREPKDINKNSSNPQKSKTQALQYSENADTSKDKAQKDKKECKRWDKWDRQH